MNQPDSAVTNSVDSDHFVSGSTGSTADESKTSFLCASCARLIAHLQHPDGYKLGDHQPHIYSAGEFKAKFACGRCPGLPGILKWTSLHLLPICHIDVLSFKESSCNDIIDKITFREWEQLKWVVYEIAPLQIAASTELGSHSVGRTWNPRYLDTTLLWQRLTACDISHGPECRTPVTPRPDHHILLIDTQRLCLVSSHGDEAYAALSYV
jgi:hypothetical protein